MTDLIQRIEQADGPCRELDAEIAKAVGAEHGRKTGFCNSENGDYYVIDECAPAYSASIDAALTLAEGMGGSVTFYKGGGAKAFFWQPYPMAIEAKASNIALAICAASLRARAITEGRNVD